MAGRAFYKGKKILVTGSAGFVGTNLVEKLVSKGARVRGTLFKNSPQLQLDGVDYIVGDLTSSEFCSEVVQDIDYVFMCAANSSGAAVMESRPLSHLTPNVVMNSQMLAAAYEAGVKKFCFISSNTVYPLTDFAVSEKDASYNFFDKYFVVAWMKRFSEIMCEMYSEKIDLPMQTITVRPGNLYGPYDKYSWNESKVVAALIRRAIERHQPFEVWGDGQDIKDFLYIDDFVTALCDVFEHRTSWHPINIASGIPVTVEEVLKHILEICDLDPRYVKFDKSKPTMIPRRMIDITLLKDEMPTFRPLPIELGLRKTVNWYKRFYKDASPAESVK